MRTVPSRLPVTSPFPSGVNRPQVTESWCPKKDCMNCPLSAFHIQQLQETPSRGKKPNTSSCTHFSVVHIPPSKCCRPRTRRTSFSLSPSISLSLI